MPTTEASERIIFDHSPARSVLFAAKSLTGVVESRSGLIRNTTPGAESFGVWQSAADKGAR